MEEELNSSSNNNNNKEIIKKAICNYVALLDENFISEKFFKYLLPYVNLSFIPDRDLLSNKRLVENIDWSKLDNLKIIRLAIRDKTILERIDLDSRDFQLRELLPLFLSHPDLVEFFDINFSDLNPIEAINMLDVNPNFINNIDLSKYEYTNLQTNEIIKKFYKHDKIIEKLYLKKLDYFSTRTLLMKTGTKFTQKLDLTNLKAEDWLVILKDKPELLDYCNLLVFLKGDCYHLVGLIKMFPELDYLITENKDKFSAIGWEKLLILNYEKYSPMCDYNIFSKKNWQTLIKHIPEIEFTAKKFVIF